MPNSYRLRRVGMYELPFQFARCTVWVPVPASAPDQAKRWPPRFYQTQHRLQCQSTGSRNADSKAATALASAGNCPSCTF